MCLFSAAKSLLHIFHSNHHGRRLARRRITGQLQTALARAHPFDQCQLSGRKVSWDSMMLELCYGNGNLLTCWHTHTHAHTTVCIEYIEQKQKKNKKPRRKNLTNCADMTNEIPNWHCSTFYRWWFSIFLFNTCHTLQYALILMWKWRTKTRSDIFRAASVHPSSDLSTSTIIIRLVGFQIMWWLMHKPPTAPPTLRPSSSAPSFRSSGVFSYAFLFFSSPLCKLRYLSWQRLEWRAKAEWWPLGNAQKPVFSPFSRCNAMMSACMSLRAMQCYLVGGSTCSASHSSEQCILIKYSGKLLFFLFNLFPSYAVRQGAFVHELRIDFCIAANSFSCNWFLAKQTFWSCVRWKMGTLFRTWKNRTHPESIFRWPKIRHQH